MSEKGYLVAWGIYLLCSFGLLGCVWFLTRPFTRLRLPLRVMAGVFLFMPWTASADEETLAPAWLTMLFDAFLKQGASIFRAGLPLIVVLMLALGLALIWQRTRKVVP